MEPDKDILTTINRRTGMTVPEGYFESFAKRMADSLPEHPAAVAERAAKPRTLWLRVRPYAYMAAMFAGIWCMLQLFNTMSSNSDLSIDKNPVLSSALSNDSFVDEYFLDNYDEEDLLDDMYDAGITPEELNDTTANIDYFADEESVIMSDEQAVVEQSAPVEIENQEEPTAQEQNTDE